MPRVRDHVFLKYVDAPPGDVEGGLARQRERLSGWQARPDVAEARPLFTRTAEQLLQDRADLENRGARGLPDLTAWLRLRTRNEEAAAKLEAELADREDIELAYRPTFLGRRGVLHALEDGVRRFARLLDRPRRAWRRRQRARSAPERPARPAARDVSEEQHYLLSAPWGVGAVDVPGWSKLCSGPQIRIAVVDDYWNRHHEDLVGVEVVGESGRCGVLDDHGTSVVGILLSNADGHGLVGVAPGSGLVFCYPYVEGAAGRLVYSVADAIDRASAELRAGDVLLIERQIAGSPVETVRPCFDAIRHAVARGIIVIEPAGNAGGFLDDYVPPTPGHRKPGGSGAILVGAGIESSPQHGRARARIPLSCYGSCVDVQAWGAGVLTLADPPEATPQSADEAYKSFGGTSSASAIVAGVAAVASSVAKRLAPDVQLSSDMLRSLMVETGNPQFPGSADEPIGPQPDLPALLRAVRGQLCKEKGLPPPSSRPPSPDVRERWLLQLLVNGLDEAAIATIMGLEERDVRGHAARLSLQLGAETRLQLAQAVDHWDLA